MNDDRNPYAAPGARLADPPRRPGSPYKAVALGLVTDFAGSFLLAGVFGVVYAMSLSSSGMANEQVEEALRNIGPDSWYFWVVSIGGGGFSVLGGYVCGRIARQSEYTLGVVLAVLGVVLGALIGEGDHDLGTSIALNAASVACVMAGAWIAKKKNRRPA